LNQVNNVYRDVIFLGFTSKKSVDWDSHLPEFKLGNASKPEKIAEIIEAKKLEFAANAAMCPFLAEIDELAYGYGAGPKVVTVSSDEAVEELAEICDARDGTVWPVLRVAPYSEFDSAPLLVGFGVRTLVKIAAVQAMAAGKPFRFRFHRDNLLCFDPLEQAMSEDVARYVTKEKLFRLTCPHAGPGYTPHQNASKDVEIAQELFGFLMGR